MRCQKETMLLYAVTSPNWVGTQTLPEQVASALRGGATCIQLREKNLDAASRLAAPLQKLCRQYKVPFIVNDHVSLALDRGADGIHVGQKDLQAGTVRSMVGDHMILGVSVRTVAQALAAQEAGADYLGVGAVFSTGTKLDADQVSHQALREIRAAVKIPVVAIGGINKENILSLSGSGVDGVALVSAIFSARDIEGECRVLKQLSREMTAT